VTAQELTSGGLLIEIADKGIGVSETRLAEMNWRLDNPPVIDVSVSRHMGLFAVARLAERHHIRVRLRPANPQGLSVLVWLPEVVIERTTRGYSSTGGAWSKPFAAQAGLLSRRAAASQQIIGARSAVQSRPAAAAPVEEDDQLMSTWFRSRRITATGVGVGTGNTARPAGGLHSAPTPPGWSGPLASDPWAQGRHAAEIIADPIHGDRTAAGLPVRVPKANLLPGSAGPVGPGHGGPNGPGGGPQDGPGGTIRDPQTQTQAQALPRRSPETARSRLGGFQRGARRAEGRRTSAEEPAGFGQQERGADS